MVITPTKESSLCLLQYEQTLNLSRSTGNDELIEEFLAWKRTYSPHAANRYRLWVTRFQKLVNKPPEQMRFQDFVAFSDGVRGRYAPKNVQYSHNIIHNYLRYFFEQGRLNFPLHFVRVPRARAESHYCITESESRSLIESFHGSDPLTLRNLTIIRLLHDSGMRVGELVAVNLRDIGSGMTAVIETEKTVEERRIFWTKQTDAVLRRYLEIRREFGANDPALFVAIGHGNISSRNQRRLSARSIERIVKQSCQRAGVTEKVCPHSFRHAFIHRMARKGTPDAIIARMVGHSTPHTIAHYTKLSRPEMEAFYRADSLAQVALAA